jgi:predicted Zn finger-like uncharacterized protein
MKFFCDQCNAQYMIADEKVGAKGVKVKCKKCSHIIVVKPAAAASAPATESATTETRSGATQPAAAVAPAAAPAPRKTEVEISGAFDSLFGGGAASGGGGGGEAPFGGSSSVDAQAGAGVWSNNPTVMAKAPSLAAVSEKEWYVAIDDAQVGPIDIAEVQQRWDNKELSEDSLAWKAGMPDWIPLADIPELSYLVTERPHKAKTGAAAASTAGNAAAAKSAAAIEWKPSAASALSSLVQEELIAAKAPKEASASKPPEGVPDLGLPSFGTNDLFGGKVGGAPIPAGGDLGGGGGGGWSVPSSRPSSGGSKSLYVVIGGVAIVVIALLGATFFLVVKTTQQVAQVRQSAPIAQPPVAQAVPQPAAPAAPQPAAAAPAPAPAPAAAAEEPEE